MKIYTKTGDSGTTGLVDGSRLSKHEPRIATLGAIDEANAAIGLAAVVCSEHTIGEMLTVTQSWLFNCGSRLAEPTDESSLGIALPGEAVLRIYEDSIDTMTQSLPPLKQFILPGGTEASARLHMARAIVRRAERELVGLQASGAHVPSEIIKYMNRLSDWLFTAARYVNYAQGVADVVWRPHK